MKKITYTFDQAIKRIKADIDNRIYLLLGPDVITKKAILDQLQLQILDPEGISFDRNVIWADEKDSCDKFSELAQCLPVFSKYKFLIVRNAEHFKPSRRSPDISKILDIPDTTLAVFLTDAGDGKKFLSSRRCPAILKEISAYSETFMFLDPLPAERREFTEYLERMYGYKLDTSQKKLILEKGPQSATGLHQIFQMLPTGIKETKNFMLDDLLGRTSSLEDVVFAVGDKDLNQTLELLDRSLKWGFKTQDLVLALSKHFYILGVLKSLSKKMDGFSLQRQMTKEYGLYVPYENMPRYISQSGSWKEEEIGKVREILFCKTLDLRSGGTELFLSLSALIGDIIFLKI
ncbi:hypothetical protein JW890_01220 [candidate division WOR-3 bacterium]|nr:hypothetical protein [candidate division WOR-3 bacterium]